MEDLSPGIGLYGSVDEEKIYYAAFEESKKAEERSTTKTEEEQPMKSEEGGKDVPKGMLSWRNCVTSWYLLTCCAMLSERFYEESREHRDGRIQAREET